MSNCQRYKGGVATKDPPKTKPKRQVSKIKHFANELHGKYVGKPAFVMGNGWSVKYYDSKKMAEDGVIVACNMGFKIHPADFVVFQDSKVTVQCFTDAKCKKFAPIRKAQHPEADLDNTYFFAFGKVPEFGSNNIWHSGHTGGLAFQLAVLLGCDPVFLVGCDCCLLRDKNKEYHSNVFNDRYRGYNVKRIARVRDEPSKKVKTVSVLQGFARKFEKVYHMVKDMTTVYRLGAFGIVNIPSIDIASYWTKDHPSYDGKP